MGRGLLQGASGGRRWPLLAPIVVAVLAFAAGSATAGPGLVRIGSLPRAAADARTVGTVPAATRMHVTIVLKARNPASLADYAREVSTLGSSSYHQFLTPGQFAARFGASPATVTAVQRSMRAHGLLAGPAATNRLSVPVTGSADAVERAFSVALRVGLSDGRRAVVASAAPAVDRSIAGEVQAVIGLTSVGAPKPLLARSSPSVSGRGARSAAIHAAGDGPQPCSSASTTASADGAYTADQIASIYGFDGIYASGAEGQGQTIAIFELESYDPSDVATYQSCYGTSTPITTVSVDGGPGGNPAGSGEAALDIEQAIGLAPRARIIVYEGPNSSNDSPGSGPYDTLNAIVAQDRADVVSISWGQCEPAQGSNVLNAEQTLFEEAATQGQSVVSATGDNGSEDCFGSNGLAVDDPGSQQFVTGVGGTSIQAPGPPPAETVWNRPGSPSGPLTEQGGAGGGGVSNAWTMPGYQSNAARSLNVIGPYSSGSNCLNYGGKCRQVPDVTADADPKTGYVIYWNGFATVGGMPTGWQAVGGTSAAAPVWAALLADADSTSACHGSAIGFANPALYHAASSGYGNYFNDVTSGNNDLTQTNGGLYPAAAGYDMASGLGSPKATALAAALCADALRVNSPGAQLSSVGQFVSLAIGTTALPGSQLHFYASHLPRGLSISASTGRITGHPKSIGSWSSGVAALDQNLSLRGAFFSWRVVGAPVLSAVRLSGVGGGGPKLTFTLTAGRAAALLKTISITLPSGLSFGHTGGRVRVLVVGRGRVRISSRLVGGRLRLELPVPAWQIRVTILPGAIRATARIAGEAGRRTPPQVTLALMTTDAVGHGVAVRALTRPRR